jgi:hypothetical protein
MILRVAGVFISAMIPLLVQPDNPSSLVRF